jgi:hypothetical protein
MESINTFDSLFENTYIKSILFRNKVNADEWTDSEVLTLCVYYLFPKQETLPTDKIILKNFI